MPPGDLPHPGIKSRSPTLQADSLPAEAQEKPKNTGVGMEGRLLGKGGTWNDRSGKEGRHIWLRRIDIRNVVTRRGNFSGKRTISCGVFWFWMKCTKMNIYRRTIGQWNKDQRDSAFWKMYQVVIHEDQIAHSKRYEDSKITFEWWIMRDTIATCKWWQVLIYLKK